MALGWAIGSALFGTEAVWLGDIKSFIWCGFCWWLYRNFVNHTEIIMFSSKLTNQHSTYAILPIRPGYSE
jgi:hypothetical protein